MEVEKKIIQSIIGANDIAIVMHNNPDSDAIGSAIALENVLKQLNKQVTIITQNKIKKKYSEIFGSNRVNKVFIPNEYFDILFVVDCSDESRISINTKEFSDNVIVIDHHEGFSPYGNIYWCENVIANSMLIFKLIKMMIKTGLNVLFNENIATALYMGIRGDSFNFRNPNVTSTTFEVCAELLKYHVKCDLVNEIEKCSMGILRLEKLVWDSLLYDERYKILYVLITQDMLNYARATYEDASQIIDVMKLIKNVDVAIVFISSRKNVYIKTRSTKYNIAKVMQQYGGGGHRLAAGAVCYNDSTSYALMNAVIKSIKEEIDDEKKV